MYNDDDDNIRLGLNGCSYCDDLSNCDIIDSSIIWRDQGQTGIKFTTEQKLAALLMKRGYRC